MDAILETAFNDQTGDLAPVSNWTLQTLTLKGQLPDIRAKMEAGGLISTLLLLFFLFFSSVLLWRLFSPLCLWRVETVDERESIILVFLRRLSGASFGFIQCQPFGSALCCLAPPPTIPFNPQFPHNPLFCKWLLVMANQYCQIKNGIWHDKGGPTTL